MEALLHRRDACTAKTLSPLHSALSGTKQPRIRRVNLTTIEYRVSDLPNCFCGSARVTPCSPSFPRRWKPTLVLDQAAQIFDLTGVAGVAVDDAGEPDA
jgi:hypothetical protein